MKNPPRFLRACFIVLSVWMLALAPRASALNAIGFEDIFGRSLNTRGMTLVDWEGQIANPAIKIFVRPPSDATFPATAVISSTQPRLYFDLPSTATATGPSKTLSFPNSTPVPELTSRDAAARSRGLLRRRV